MPLGKRLSSLESRGGRAEFAGIRLPDLGVTTCESAFWCRALDPFNSTVRRDSRAVVGRRSWLARAARTSPPLDAALISKLREESGQVRASYSLYV